MVTSIWLPLDASISFGFPAHVKLAGRDCWPAATAGRTPGSSGLHRRTYQNVFKSHSYIFLNSPAMMSALTGGWPVEWGGWERKVDKYVEASGGFGS